MVRPFGLVMVMIALAGPALAQGTNEPDGPLQALPARVVRVLDKALESYPFDDNSKEAWIGSNRKYLRLLETISWPDFAQVQRVRLYDAKDAARVSYAWHFPAKGADLVLLQADFTWGRIPRTRFAKLEPVKYADELDALLAYLNGRGGPRRPFEFTFFADGAMPFHPGVYLLHHAVAAAHLGHDEAARQLVHFALRQRREAFEFAYQEAAWQSFYRGIHMLEQGSPRTEVLAQWKRTLKHFAPSEYGAQLKDLIAQLEQQIPEDKKNQAATVKDLGQLPLDDRIAYYLARLPDVRGEQISAPGHCWTLGLGERTAVSDGLVKIGRPAVPKLIEHLHDRRLTCSIGFQRPFYANRVVLRGQDVAVQCIEAILDLRFYHPTSTRSYLSNESSKVREAVIADITKWWNAHGFKTPVEGYLARLDQVGYGEGLELIRKIEAIDKKAVDPVARIKQWALTVHYQSLPDLARELAARGDLSLLPSMREILRTERHLPSSLPSFLVRHGDASDFRELRANIRRVRERGRPTDSEFFLNMFRSALIECKRPLAVPLLVDWLDERGIVGTHTVDGKQVAYSHADRCLLALIPLTGPDWGYRADAADEERFAAMDRWLRWWRDAGEAEFVKKHPEVGRVLHAAVSPGIDVAARPALVEVHAAAARSPVRYLVPREDVAKLLRAGAVVARPDKGDAQYLQFRRDDDARAWFAAAAPVLPKRTGTGTAAVRIGPDGWKGPVRAPDGRSWFWEYDAQVPVAEVRRQVESAGPGPEIHVRGAQVLHADRSGRLWLIPDADPHRLLGYDPKARRWLERNSIPGPNAKELTSLLRITGPAFEDSRGRLFFSDSLGVHVLDGEQWSYQPLFDRNFQDQKFYGQHRAFNSPQFAEEHAGNVYAWATWGQYGRTGTIGFWLLEGKTWRQVDGVERLRALVPRGPNQVWLVNEDDQLALLQAGKLSTGADVRLALSPHLHFQSARLRTLTPDREAIVELTDVMDARTLLWKPWRYLLLPPRGPIRELTGLPLDCLEKCRSRDLVFAPDGWVWGTDGQFVLGFRLDRAETRVLHQLGPFTGLTVRGHDAKGRLCVTGNGQLWRVDPARAHAGDTDAEARLPAMQVRVKGLATLDTRGRMWCCWDVPGYPAAMFDDHAWNVHPEPERSNHWGFHALYPGQGGSVLAVGSGYQARLFDAEGVAAAPHLQALLDLHPGRVAAGLTCPPLPSQRHTNHLVKDALGRLWWADWERDWGVIAGDRKISAKGSDLAFRPGPGKTHWMLTPIGDGTRVLAGLQHGVETTLAIVAVAGGKMVKVADGPEIHPLWRGQYIAPYVLAGSGRVWIATRDGSVAIDSAGKVAARHKGIVLREDSAGCLWFQENDGDKTHLVRQDPRGREVRVHVPDLLEVATLAEGPDGDFWTLSRLELLLLRPTKDGFAIVERYPQSISPQDRLWCDPTGRVWRLHHGHAETQLLCGATRKGP